MIGWLQHSAGPKGPFSTERATVRHVHSDIYQARYEGRWRMVHVQIKRLYIVYRGKKIEMQIEGNPV